MKKFFILYEYLIPLILFPLSYILLLSHYSMNNRLVLSIVFLPVIYAYVIPGIGVNILKLWEFKSKHKIGGYRIQHGFVFGAGANFMAWLILPTYDPNIGFIDIIKVTIVMGLVFGLTGLFYDVYGLKAKYILIFNKHAYEGKHPFDVSTQYAPHLFGGFGLAFSISIFILESHFKFPAEGFSFLIFLLTLLLVHLMPLVFYFVIYYLINGDFGLKSYKSEIINRGEK